MVSLSQTTFTNSLRETIPIYVHSVDVETVIAAGSTRMREVVSKEELGGLLKAYSKALDRVFYLCTAIAAVSWAFSWFMGWKDVRSKRPVEKQTDV